MLAGLIGIPLHGAPALISRDDKGQETPAHDLGAVPEQLGSSKTPDLVVSSNRRRWAVECKRINRSGDELEEHACAEAFAKSKHRLEMSTMPGAVQSTLPIP